ncbi:hypothetical protein DMENIID0001_105980 [Sergentomyia squamirostris]
MASASGLKQMTPAVVRDLCKKNNLYLTPRLNDVLYLHYQGFQEIAGLEEYTGLKCLWLECNAISELKGLEHQEELKCLFLQNNLIKKIENLHQCSQLDTLNLSHNQLRHVDNCNSDILPVLTTLTISHNYIRTAADIENLTKCDNLSVLDLSHNKIDDILVVKVFARMANLRVLTLVGNPIVGSIPSYRKTIILECLSLTYLDTRPVFPKDRALAEAWKRGGFQAEKEENERWNREERRKMRESINRVLRRRNEIKGEQMTELIGSSSDEEDFVESQKKNLEEKIADFLKEVDQNVHEMKQHIQESVLTPSETENEIKECDDVQEEEDGKSIKDIEIHYTEATEELKDKQEESIIEVNIKNIDAIPTWVISEVGLDCEEVNRTSDCGKNSIDEHPFVCEENNIAIEVEDVESKYKEELGDEEKDMIAKQNKEDIDAISEESSIPGIPTWMIPEIKEHLEDETPDDTEISMEPSQKPFEPPVVCEENHNEVGQLSSRTPSPLVSILSITVPLESFQNPPKHKIDIAPKYQKGSPCKSKPPPREFRSTMDDFMADCERQLEEERIESERLLARYTEEVNKSYEQMEAAKKEINESTVLEFEQEIKQIGVKVQTINNARMEQFREDSREVKNLIDEVYEKVSSTQKVEVVDHFQEDCKAITDRLEKLSVLIENPPVNQFDEVIEKFWNESEGSSQSTENWAIDTKKRKIEKFLNMIELTSDRDSPKLSTDDVQIVDLECSYLGEDDNDPEKVSKDEEEWENEKKEIIEEK